MATEDIPKHAGGRPLKFANVAEFQIQADDYFAKTPEAEWTITGLALHLDTFRDVLIDYQNKDEFSYAVKRAKQKVEMSYEKSLRKNGRAGDIFGLKNFGWRDKTEVDSTVVADVTSNGETIDATIVTGFTDYLKGADNG